MKQRELLQSIMAALAAIQNVSDEALQAEGVAEMLKDMDSIAWEVVEVVES